ncbi:hypothetical protein [Stenotrophomonas phage RAS14]
MELYQQLLLTESQRAAQKEIDYSISVVNKIYNEWKKSRGRRINAVDLITTSANKISTLNPDVVSQVHEATREKLTVIIMRCMDIPPWKDPYSKEKIYTKLYPLITKLETYNPNTGTGGNLREAIMTRLSSTLCHSSKEKVFVAYEPTISAKYIDYMFSHDSKPKKTYKMRSLKLPSDFESLMDTLEINQEKAEKAFKSEKEKPA